ncbi:uncharacterized protein LOC18428685 isoform X3 [Amborella trichopoda]|uniref:uncharacterized protein LOC18428685 isoform X3 n=1 Tax=Amborella trichopoda TaxID=13333 RepID=UPI0009C0682B|nr:uncharacterized protein LOC18428685 isoform X3 [Amborella trichopoda]|eukprot:XP_020519552.1 uncharacterized protein LOC18428685 isoform X3 [Amborella trichopoda]
MDDEQLLRVVQEDYFNQHHSSLLQSLPLHVSFDYGCHLLVKAIQELRGKKESLVTVGIGGPSGSGKTSLAEKVASVFGCVVMPMDNYRDGVDDKNDFESIDFDTLIQNLEDLMKGSDILMPVFDFQEKKRIGLKKIKSSLPGVVIVDGTYALHAKLRSLLDIRVAVVGGVHFSLLSKVRYDIGDSCSLDDVIDSIFPLFRKHIEPDLHHAQIRINNSFVSSFREPYYKLKCRCESPNALAALPFHTMESHNENFIEMYLRPPSAHEAAKINDWIKVRQSGIRYFLSLGDQRIVDKSYIIRPKAEFEVGRMTLGGLLALGYTVVVSFKRASTTINTGKVSISLESIDILGEKFLVLKGTDRKVIGVEASTLGVKGPWITKSYLEMILEHKGVPRLCTPPPLSTTSSAGDPRERGIIVPKPIRVTSFQTQKISELVEPWTRSPTKSEMEPVVAPMRWHFISQAVAESSASRYAIQLAPMPDSYDLGRGLHLAIQAIQALLEAKGLPIIVGIGGPSGSGKTSMAHKMANFVGCEVISLESYYKSEHMRDLKYDDFSSLDLALLLKNIDDIRNRRSTKVPSFDFENCTRSGFRNLEVSEDCGVLKIRNDFDPVYSSESSLFVLKSNKQVSYQELMNVLDPEKITSSVQHFTDIYLRLPRLPSNGLLAENECIRVRMCEGRFALLIREPIREGNFLMQPKVDFDISVSTVAGLLNLGYHAVSYIEASAQIYQDDKILIEVNHLQDVPTPYLQIKGPSKEAVAAAGLTLNLDGSYTTKTYLEIILDSTPTFGRAPTGIHGQQAARLHELVEYIQSQGGSSGSESSPSREALPVECIIEDLQLRVKRLERWHMFNTVMWTFLMSSLVGYSLYQRRRN